MKIFAVTQPTKQGPLEIIQWSLYFYYCGLFILQLFNLLLT